MSTSRADSFSQMMKNFSVHSFADVMLFQNELSQLSATEKAFLSQVVIQWLSTLVKMLKPFVYCNFAQGLVTTGFPDHIVRLTKILFLSHIQNLIYIHYSNCDIQVSTVLKITIFTETNRFWWPARSLYTECTDQNKFLPTPSLHMHYVIQQLLQKFIILLTISCLIMWGKSVGERKEVGEEIISRMGT